MMIVYCLKILNLLVKVQIYGAIGSSRGKALIKNTVQTARACLVGVFEFMCNSDLIRIDE